MKYILWRLIKSVLKAQPSMNRVNGMLVLTIVDRDIRFQIISVTAASVWEYAYERIWSTKENFLKVLHKIIR